jgi:hypothetical protein
MAITQQQQQNIIALTVAMFNAAPGADNLSDFANFIDGGGTLQQLAENLAASAPFNSQYAGQVTLDGKLNVALNNLGLVSGTAAYDVAKAHFEARLGQGWSTGEILLEASDYLFNNDSRLAIFDDAAAALSNKVEVATYFSVDLAQSAGSLADLKDVVAGVTSDPATVEAAKAELDAAAVAGETFTLTAGLDDFTGTSDNDVFKASLTIDPATTTYNPGDAIDGGDGFDTLRLSVSDTTFDGGIFEMSNVEQVDIQNFSGGQVDLDAAFWSGVDEIRARGNGDINIVNVTEAFSTVSFQNFTADNDLIVTVDDSVFAGSDDTLTVNLANAGNITSGNEADLDLTNASLADVIENLHVNSISNNAGGNEFRFSNAGVLDSITLEGAADLLLNLDGSDVVTTVDASAMTGDLTWADDFDADTGAPFDYTGSQGADSLQVDAENGADITISLGGGNDFLDLDSDFGGAVGEITVDLGDGDDLLEIQSGAVGDYANATLTLGAGTDDVVVTVGTIQNLTGTSNADLNADLITITDFNGAEDTLDLAVTGDRAILTNTEQNSVSAAADLAGALTAATSAADFDDGDWVSFQFQGNTYIFEDVIGDVTEDAAVGDGLVELTGFTGTIDATNFVGA